MLEKREFYINVGHRLYRRINETHFRRVILGMILVSGISLFAGG